MPVGVADAPQADALAWLPLVGAVTGALAGTAGWLVSLVAPHPLAAAAAFAAVLVLTGAIHLDGFLDCCDALFAPVPLAQRLEYGAKLLTFGRVWFDIPQAIRHPYVIGPHLLFEAIKCGDKGFELLRVAFLLRIVELFM